MVPPPGKRVVASHHRSTMTGHLLHLTAHAATRTAQRAIASDDVELISLIGTEV